MMSSSQVSGLISSQQAMFGNFYSYSQQITPPFAGMPGGGMQGAPPMGYGSPYGMGVGVPPPPPPMPVMAAMNPYANRGFFGSMGQMGYDAFTRPGSGAEQMMGERLVGGGMNVARMGADFLNPLSSPMGAGMTAGMGAMGIGSIGGAVGLAGAGTALLAAAPVAAGLAVGAYGLHQMGQGVEQRQAVNRVLRSRFGGQMGVGGGQGGRGFSTEEMGGISTMLRSMGTEDLFSNTEELTRVMDRTAQMGLYRGVRSAQEFRDKFRQVTDSLKTIATTMGTTLEEATGFMDQSRQMGFFSGREITANLMQTRLGAAATGMSVGQVQQMGMMGTQIGRSMGMRGKTGAQAMQNIGLNIAQGMQMGIFSDEMISEMTGGLTGAEGATAVARRMMEINQNFLSKGEGRVTLAGLWDPRTGRINTDVMRQLQSGQLSFRELRTMGRGNIAATGGRASDFFAQEERLRGMAMEEGSGSLLMMGALQEHFGRRRGVSLEDPIMQRFMRKRYGMSQEEVEGMVKEYREMPRIIAQRESRQRQELENMAGQKAREMSGIQGMERKLSQWWEQQTEFLRQAGDDLTTTVTKSIEGITGAYYGRTKLQISREAKQAYENLAMFGTTMGNRGLLTSTEYKKVMQNIYASRPSGIEGVAYTGLMGTAQGLMEGGSRFLGGLLGMRSTEDPAQQAQRLGLGVATREGFRRNAQRDPTTGKWTRGEIVQGADLRNLIVGAQEEIAAGPAGFSEAEIAKLGAMAAESVTRTYGFNQRWEKAVGSADAGDLMEKRIQELSRANPALRAALEKAGRSGDPRDRRVRQAALVNAMERSSGISTTTLASPIMQLTGGVNTADLESATRAINEHEANLAQQIATMKDPTRRRKVHSEARGGGYYYEKGGTPLGLDADAVQRVFQNDEIREGLQAVVSGTSAERGAAAARLVQRVRDKNSGMSADDKKAVERMTGMALRSGKEGEQMRGLMRDYLQDEAARSTLAVQQREAELGRELSRGLAEKRYAFAGMEEGYAKLENIAKLRKAGNIEGALAAEREFLASGAAKDPRFQKAMAGVGALGYMTREIGRTEELEQRYRGGRGGSSITMLMQDVLGAAGVDMTQDRRMRKDLERALVAGDMPGIETQLTKMGATQAQIEAIRGSKYAQESILATKGGLTKNEQAEMARLRAVQEGASARLEGTPTEVNASSALQKDQLNVMKLQLKATMEIASKSGKLSPDTIAAIGAATKGEGEESTP